MQFQQKVFQCIAKPMAIAWIFIIMQGSLQADVIRDGSIGPDVSVQLDGPNFEIPESVGELNGTNLFHSFQELSLSADQSATFFGISPIDNIIARVTGDKVSHINGLLRSTVPGADLYLMNPRGVIFGANANLDVQGTFHASTADELVFADGAVFSSVLGSSAPILSVAIPEEFGFLGSSAAPIELHSSTLTSAYDVALSGGTIALRNGASIVTATENARDGADISLSAIDAVLLSGTNDDGQGSGLDASTRSDGSAGEIRVEAPLIELQDGAWVWANTSGSGNGGTLKLTASERLTLSGRDTNGLSSGLQAQAAGAGNAGIIHLQAPIVELGAGADSTTATTGLGNGGELLVTATERITLSGKNSAGLGAAFNASTSDEGMGGTVRVTAPVIELRDGANLITSTAGVGDAGDVLVNAEQRLTLSGTNNEGFGASLQANTQGDGTAGNILVRAPVIELQDGASMQSNTAGAGAGGELRVTATEKLTLSGTDDNGFGANLQTTTSDAGMGGTLSVKAPVVELRDGAFMRTNTAGVGLGGALTVNASERLILYGIDDHGVGSRLEAIAQEQGDGVGINIQASEIILTEAASIATTSVSTGNAGSISIKVEETLQLTANSSISTAALTAAGGNINIQAGSLVHLSDSDISTNVGSGPGGGGGVTIAADALALNHSNITARADFGSGGNIQISANQVLVSPDSVIDASAGPAGINGNVDLSTPENNLTSELARPATAFLDASAALQPSCEARARESSSSFSVARQQGLPLSPEDLLLAFETVAPLPRPAVTTPLELSALGAGTAQRSEVLRGIALKQQTEGQYSASLKTLNAALTADNHQPQQLATTLGSAANAYLALDQAETALAHFNQAIAAAAEDEHLVLATLHNNLGNLYMVQQDFTAASAAYRESARRFRWASDVTQEAKALSNGARAALAESRPQHAALLLEQAHDIAHILPMSQDKAHIFIHLAKTAQQLNVAVAKTDHDHLATAYSDLRNAVMLSENLGDDRSLSYALGNLGGLYQQQNRLDEALYLTRLAQYAAERANASESQYRWHWQAGRPTVVGTKPTSKRPSRLPPRRRHSRRESP